MPPAGSQTAHSSLPKDSRILIVVNRQAGTVRTMGPAAIEALLVAGFGDFAVADIRLVDGADIGPTVSQALAARSHDVIIVGGGDGTVSSVAGLLTGSGVTMGVLPLGTMNLVAKAIRLAPALPDAIRQLANGRIGRADIGLVNGRVFLHQASFGLQPRVVRIREKIGYRSRVTKLLSSAVAILSVLARPRAIRMVSDIDGQRTKLKVPALAISNNLYRTDRPPVPDGLSAGVLGVYVLKAQRLRDYARLVVSLLRGTWENEEMVETAAAHAVRLEVPPASRRKKTLVSIDGELEYMNFPIDITIKPGAIKMLLPLDPA